MVSRNCAQREIIHAARNNCNFIRSRSSLFHRFEGVASGGKKKIVPHSRRKKNGEGARGETRKGETEREIGPSLEKKTFLEPWINTAVVKSEEHADERRE